MIILTKEQANEVRGNTGAGSALDPVKLKSGEYVLNEAVLSDPAHSMLHEFLNTLPTREVTKDEIEQDDDLDN
jgi:hypothetical protein